MSELVEAAAAALGIPAELAERSAAARAAETGASAEDVLTAWSGGAPAPAPVASAVPETAPEAASPPPTEAPAAPVVAAPVMEIPSVAEVVVEQEPSEPLDPVSFGDRIGTAAKIGAWTGAGLGLVAFFIFSAFWATRAAVLPDIGPIVQVSRSSILIGAALVSVVFGAVVAGFSRAATAWTNPAKQLRSSKSSTARLGAILGVVLGFAGGALLASFGTAVEGSEEGLIQLPVLASLGVLLIGGAVLGAVTAAVPQIFGTPVAVSESDEAEVDEVRSRLGGAVGVPVAGLLILVLLVIPFGWILIQSNHLASGGAAVVAIVIASGILGFATLAGSRPEMKISLGDLAVAIAGIGTVLVIVLAVLLFNSDETHEEDEGGEAQATVTQLI